MWTKNEFKSRFCWYAIYIGQDLVYEYSTVSKIVNDLLNYEQCIIYLVVEQPFYLLYLIVYDQVLYY
jgi:hypothetical protein